MTELLGLLDGFLKLPENVIKLKALFVDAGYPQAHVNKIVDQALRDAEPPSQKGDPHA